MEHSVLFIFLFEISVMRISTSSIIIVSFFIALSCVSSGGASNVTTGNTAAPSIKEQVSTGYWITHPSANSITIIGVSNNMVKRDSEIEAAKEDAARKVALFHGLSGTFESVNQSGSRGFIEAVNFNDKNINPDTNYERYIDQLIYDPERDVIKTDEALFIRFQYNASMDTVNYVSSKDKNNRPNWTSGRELPRIDGYLTSVGFAQKQRWLKDTIYKSTEEAAVRMIQDVSMQVHASDTSKSGGGVTGSIYTISEGKLKNFLVLEFWIDPANGSIYTLAIARQVN